MALVYLDRVQETSTTQGSGAYDLDGAVLGYQAFTDVGNGNTCYYAATDGRSWEVGLGTYVAASARLIRTSVLDGSNGISPVSWRAGTKYVWIDYPAAAISSGIRGETLIVTSSGTVTVAADVGTVLINKGAPSATPISLPAVATRNGLSLTVSDFAGNGGDLTITAFGAETIMGLPTAVIGSFGPGIGSAASVTLYPSVDLSGWYA